MNLQNKTLIDRETYSDFQLFRARYIKRSAFLNYTIFVLWAIFCAGLIVLGILVDAVIAILLGIVALILLFRIFMDKCIKPKKKFEKNNLKEATVNYLFMRNSFRIPKDDNPDDTSSIRYDQLQKVYETKDIFYLYLQKNICYLVAKNGFSSEDLITFTEKMHEVMGKNYIICK